MSDRGLGDLAKLKLSWGYISLDFPGIFTRFAVMSVYSYGMASWLGAGFASGSTCWAQVMTGRLGTRKSDHAITCPGALGTKSMGWRRRLKV